MRWRSVKFLPAKLAQNNRCGVKLNHSFSVGTPAWFMTCSSSVRQPANRSSYRAAG